MSPRTKEQVQTDLAGIFANFEGKEYSGEIGPHTLFFGEMGYASIDAVVLIAELRERNVDDIAVGELAAFLHKHLSNAGC
jgi:acyl carrier protein